MKKLLLIGIDTRSMLNSALKLNYEIFSTSYFSTSDTPRIKHQKIIINEAEDESCGIFEDQFNSASLLELSKDYIDEVDYIIPISGVSPSDFSKKHKKKILGTRNVKNIENKYQFYKDIKDEFLTPKTFCINDMDEAIEINKNYEDIQFILKPLYGSGGYDINLLENDGDIQLNGKQFMLQEYITGINVSSSILSSKDGAKTVINTRLITQHDLQKNNNFIYIGNILPLTNESIMAEVKDIGHVNKTMNHTSEDLAQKFDLMGSNGVDYILNVNGLYVIEINPRIQGTFECVEKSLEINMLDAHIKACQGEIIEIPEPKCYAYKKIVYSPTRMKYEKIDLNNIFDLPHIGSITEKSEPLLTIIDKDDDFEKLYEKVESSSRKVNQVARKSQLDVK